jgi:hypothetical protein
MAKQRRRGPAPGGARDQGQTNDPQLAGGEGQTETRGGAPVPRYDDAPAPAQRSERERTPLPGFGDTEPGDPRRLDVSDR